MVRPRIQRILTEQRRSGQFCDVILKLPNGRREWAHYCVLAAQSDFLGSTYFRQADMHFSMHRPMTIEVHDFDCGECLKRAIDSMYSDEDDDDGVGEEVADDAEWNSAEHGSHIQHLGRLLRVEPLTKAMPAHDDKSPEEAVMLIPETSSRSFPYKIQSAEPSLSKMHKCLGCPFKCYRPSEMLYHMQVCRSNNTTCNMCDKRFDTLAEFKSHLVRHDNHPRPFFCADCDQRFTTKTALNLHTPKHSQATPHPCPNCPKRFKWKHGLRNHMLVHANEKRLLCDECGYSTSHLKTLRAHQLSHTGIAFRCPTTGCSYTSRRKENLAIHIATHRNEMPFVCEVCGHRFSQNKNLKRHALLHVAKNLHKCPHCQFTSYRTDKLKEHMVRQHTEKPLQLELDECVPSALLDDDDGDGDVGGQAMRVVAERAKRKSTVVAARRSPSGTVRAKRKPAFILPKSGAETLITNNNQTQSPPFGLVNNYSPNHMKVVLNSNQTLGSRQVPMQRVVALKGRPPPMIRSRERAPTKLSTRPVFILPKNVATE